MEICERSKCTGCSACVNVCPKDAISFEKNEKGFFYPHIDETKCVECGRCRKACHINNDIELNVVKDKYLFRNGDFAIRRKSSSGGAFMPIASKVVQEGGTVFGAEFGDKLYIQHNSYNDDQQIQKFSTSKYVQSDLRDSFSKVQSLLKEGKKVLFSGTPCQVSGLKSFLKVVNCPTENLITVDFVCHGTGSPKFWEDCLKFYEKKYKSEVVGANFRGKPRPGKLQNLALTFANGKKFNAPSANMEVYLYHFLKDYILRDGCFSCKYSNVDRVSDITMGDCYRPGTALSYLDDGFGLSQVMVNTEKGREFVESFKSSGELVQVDVNEYIQPNQKRPTKKPASYDSFWKAYVEQGFNGGLKASNYTTMKNRVKHCLLAITYYLNIDPKKVIGAFKK